MIKATNLSKTFGNLTALSDLNLIIPSGEIFCMLGQNGAGKTTTINIFLGFTNPTSGSAFIAGKEVEKSNSNKEVAYIPEVVMLYGYLTGIENLSFFSQLAGFRYTKEELIIMLEKVGLSTDAMNKRVSGYSKGMRQKVGIAIALAKNAKAIFMDEPTSGLDPKANNEFSAIVKQLGMEGKAIFMATHDIFNAVNIGTRIGIMRAGKLVHTLESAAVTAIDLQNLYLETMQD